MNASGRTVPLVIGAAAFAVVWAAVRAGVQDVTLDEAMTFTNFVFPSPPNHWAANANNHVLNSMLMRLFVSIFGISNFTVRSGALTGAVIYICAAYGLSRLAAPAPLMQLFLFACLVFNPLVFDFLVAARGYGLAMAFLACAIWVVARAKRSELNGGPSTTVGAMRLASVSIALSFVSNFSFGFVGAAVLALLYGWAAGKADRRARLAADAIVPGLAVTVVLAGWTLLNWRKDQLNYGARSLWETVASVYQASLYELNPNLMNPLLYPWANRLAQFIVPLILLAAGWRLALVYRRRGALDANGRWLLRFGSVAAGSMIAALVVHWVVSRLFQIPLPRDRTALYVPVLFTLSSGILAAIPIRSRGGEASRQALTILLAMLAVYFVLCLRLSYFKDWKWNSDVEQVYGALTHYHDTCGLTDIATNWRYDASLNFYRIRSGRRSIAPFESTFQYPPGKVAYVVYLPDDRGFIAQRGLKVLYAAESGAALTIDPAVAASRGMTCDAPMR